MKKVCLVALLAFVFIFAIMSTTQAQSPQETLNQYISDLQKNPNDYDLREKIIKHVQTMKPAPAIPEEAQKYMDRGIAAIESAKTTEDFQDAAAEFMKAVTAAPWLGNGYRNLAIAQDKAGQYDAALKNLQLYLLTRPSSSDEAWAKTLMNKVEYRKEKAAKESSPAAIAEKQQKKAEEFLKSLNGARYVCEVNHEYTLASRTLDINGGEVISGAIITWSIDEALADKPRGVWFEISRGQIRDRTVKFLGLSKHIGIISEDGNTIVLDFGWKKDTYRRKR